MLAIFRGFAKSWIAKILFGVLIIAFGGYGVNSMLRGKSNDDVIEAGSRSMSMAEFKTQIDQEKKQYEQEQNNGQVIPMDELVKAGVAGAMAQELATQQGFAAWMQGIGLKPSDAVVADALKQVPAFFNPVTGAFDKDNYARALAGVGLTEAAYTTHLKDDIAGKHFVLGVRAGISAPRIYGALEALTMMSTRDAGWFILGPKNIAMPDKPSDTQLNQFIAEHADRFTRPEIRAATAVMFLPSVEAKNVQVDEAELKKTYDFRKDALSQPETRSFVLIPVKTQQAAATVASALKAGGDPAVVAKSVGAQAVNVTGKPKSAVPDPAVANQAFTMQTGDVSQPVHGSLGWSVIKMGQITPGHAVSYEEAKPALEADARKRLAGEKIEDLVQKYQELRDKGVNMADAAKQLNLPMQTFPPFTKQGTSPTGQPYQINGQPFSPPKALLDSLFTLPKGGESDVEDAGNGAYFALHVDNVAPSTLLALDDKSRPPLTQMWMQQEVTLRLKALADSTAQKMRQGESLQAAAQAVGGTIQTGSNLQRPRSEQEPDAQLRATVFQTAPKDAFVAITQTGFAVGEVTAVHGPATVIAAQAVEQIRPQMTNMIFQGLTIQTQKAARDKLKAKVNVDIMDQALGVAGATGPAGAGAAAKKK